MNTLITLEHTVPVGYCQGDYAYLHGNAGEGDIDWDTPVSSERFNLFPRGAGVYGFGFAPWGHFRWGRAHSQRAAGWGHLSWGDFPWGHGTGIIRAAYEVSDCGAYKFGFTCYDELGNLHTGTPEEVDVHVHVAPLAPTGLTKESYNKTTDVLVLNTA